jgi:hypothetical protein
MKILELGRTKEKWTLEHRCTGWGNPGHTGCDALLEIEYEDLRYFPGAYTRDVVDQDPAVSFKCPCCCNLTDLGTNDWPVGYKKLTRWTAEWQDEQTCCLLP